MFCRFVAVFEGLGAVLEGLGAALGRLEAVLGNGSSGVLTPWSVSGNLFEAICGLLLIFSWFLLILDCFWFMLGRVFGFKEDKQSSIFAISFSEHFSMDFEGTFDMKMKECWKSSCMYIDMCSARANCWNTLDITYENEDLCLSRVSSAELFSRSYQKNCVWTERWFLKSSSRRKIFSKYIILSIVWGCKAWFVWICVQLLIGFLVIHQLDPRGFPVDSTSWPLSVPYRGTEAPGSKTIRNYNQFYDVELCSFQSYRKTYLFLPENLLVYRKTYWFTGKPTASV